MSYVADDPPVDDALCEDSRGYALFKRGFNVWLSVMAVITVLGALNIAWWLGIIVAMAWQIAVLFVDAFFHSTTQRPF